MNSVQHITTGAAISVATVAAYEQIMTNWTNESVVTAIESLKNATMPTNAILVALSIVFLVVGFVLPDCDMRQSLIGRIFYVPLEHRTWTHSIWPILLFVFFGFTFKPLFALAFGYFLHLFCDSFSRCGICWFYPISKYKHYGQAKVKRGHLFGYSTIGSHIVAFVIVVLCAFYVVGVLGVNPRITAIINNFDATIELAVTNAINNPIAKINHFF